MLIATEEPTKDVEESTETEATETTNEETSEETPSTESDKPGFIKIHARSLILGIVTDFDLHTAEEGDSDPVLHCRHDTVIDTDTLNKLIDLEENKSIYINDAELELWTGYVEKHLAQILAIDEISLADKIQLIYSNAQNVMEGLLTLIEAPNLVPRARALVITISEFVFATEDFFEHFLKVCNYKYSIATHGVNVLMYSLCMVKKVGIRDMGWVYNFSLGALLIDLGKANIDKNLLNQETPLNSAQWKIMRKHPVWSAETLKTHGIIDEVVLNIVLHHHEKLSGKGYPDEYRGNQIPKYVRIVTICEIFDALTTKRSYNNAADSFSALKMMQDKMSGDIDPDIFKVFVQMLSSAK